MNFTPKQSKSSPSMITQSWLSVFLTDHFAQCSQKTTGQPWKMQSNAFNVIKALSKDTIENHQL